MASFLYRVGYFAYRHRLLVIAVWVVLLAGGAASTTLAKPFLLDFNLPGTETERAGQMLDEKFPGQGDVDMMANAKVVIQAPKGTTFDDRKNIASVEALVATLRGLDHVVQPVANPLTDPARSAQVDDRTIA
jgi:RND superfamily putative drug exporter